MAKPTLHQEDLVFDNVIRQSPSISIPQLIEKTGLSEAWVRRRVDYDIKLGRAMMPGETVRFNLDKMAKRTVKPFKG